MCYAVLISENFIFWTSHSIPTDLIYEYKDEIQFFDFRYEAMDYIKETVTNEQLFNLGIRSTLYIEENRFYRF